MNVRFLGGVAKKLSEGVHKNSPKSPESTTWLHCRGGAAATALCDIRPPSDTLRAGLVATDPFATSSRQSNRLANKPFPEQVKRIKPNRSPEVDLTRRHRSFARCNTFYADPVKAALSAD